MTRIEVRALCFAFLVTASSVKAGTMSLNIPDWAMKAANATLSSFEAGNHTRIQKMAEESARKVRKVAGKPDVLRRVSTVFKDSANVTIGDDVKEKSSGSRMYYLAVSSSVPVDTLKTYVRNLAYAGGTVVVILRGFVGGMHRIGPTIDFYREITAYDGKVHDIPFQIDPDRFVSVKAVPALMGEDRACVVYGDAPLDFLVKKLDDRYCGDTFGATFGIVEKDPREEIKEAAYRLSTQKKEIARKVWQAVEELPGAGMLHPASQNATRTVVPVYTLDHDIPNPNGGVLYPAGFQFNPLDYMPGIDVHMVLISGQRKKELTWASRYLINHSTVSIFTLGGNYTQMVRTLGVPVFSGIALVKKGWCNATPCIVKRQGSFLTIREIALEERGKK